MRLGLGWKASWMVLVFVGCSSDEPRDGAEADGSAGSTSLASASGSAGTTAGTSTADSLEPTTIATGGTASSTLALSSSDEDAAASDGSTLALSSSDAGASAESGSGGLDGCDEEGPAETTGAVYEGDLLVLAADEVESIAHYGEITGSLTVGTSFVGALELPNLRRVGGDVYVEGVVTNAGDLVDSQVTHIRLPALESIGGTLWIYLNASLEALDLRRLEEIGYRFWVYRNVSLWNLRLDALRSFGGDAQVQGNPRIPSCYAEMLIEQLQGMETGAIAGDTETDCSCQATCNHIAIVCGGR